VNQDVGDIRGEVYDALKLSYLFTLDDENIIDAFRVVRDKTLDGCCCCGWTNAGGKCAG
jgi:hypothetical protein